MQGVVDLSDAEFMYTNNSNGSDSDSDDDSIIASLHTMMIEIKAHVAHTTFCAERHQLEANLGLTAYESGEPVYHEIDAEGGELNRWIPKHNKSFQLLHHVAVHDARK